jgi:hypothetical protein
MYKQREASQGAPAPSQMSSSLSSARAMASQLAAAGGGSTGAGDTVPEYFGMKNLQSRIKQYATASGQSRLSEFLKQYEKDQAQQALSLSDDESEDSFTGIDRDSV